ncbi:MAG: phenylalanine--tRNA ligase subunit beta [Opitutales bacterium]|nr:phenylalanine--tRNA ligase subunit beta [Opitutales bacterium]
MKFSLTALQSYVSLPSDQEKIVEALIRLGFEVEGIETRGYCGSGPLVVGQVQEKVPHPNSDHLSVCKVAVGQKEPLQIVCGAQNFQVGDLVPVALEGARLASLEGAQLKEVVLKKTVLRGVESCGMMCSADELGLSTTRAKGLLILNDRNPAVGTPLDALFGHQKEVIVDLSIPSNRGDCLSYVGLARELCAIFGGSVTEMPCFGKQGSNGSAVVDALDKKVLQGSQDGTQKSSISKEISCVVGEKEQKPFVTNFSFRELQKSSDALAYLRSQPKPAQSFLSLETAACDYFSGCWLENIAIQPSPEPIQAFLRASGLRPINNVVDVTNVVLLEQGQPLHAFDGDQLRGTLHIRMAQPGEVLQTLDGETYALPEGATVVADDGGVQSVAGVMGGKRSGISENTQRIFLECAHFEAGSIRRTSQKMGLSSDSSYRFERMVDRTRTPLACMRALALLRETNPQMTVKFFAEVGSCEATVRHITVRLEKINRLLGFSITGSSLIDMFEKLHFGFCETKKEVWEVTVPSWREDITQEVDFAEEWIRLNGTEKIPTSVTGGIACDLPDASEAILRMRHAEILSQAGFYESYTDSLQPKAWYEGVLSEKSLSVLCLEKPLNEDHACLRFSLIPGLVHALSENRNHGNCTECLFETGHIFKVRQDGALCECFATAFVVNPSEQKDWMPHPPFDFYQGQSWVQSLIAAGGVLPSNVYSAVKAEIPLWQAQYSGKIGCWEQRGFEANIGYLDLSFTQRWFKKEVIFAAECFWLPERIRTVSSKTFQWYPETPTITKDIALWVPKEVLCETVRQMLIKWLKKLVKHPVYVRDVRIFDVFPEQHRKSFAFSIVFGSLAGTLTDAQVQPLFDALQAHIEQSCAYSIRKLMGTDDFPCGFCKNEVG